MEPIIYKPGAYKSPGIYKGAGCIYKGRGVYNGGENFLTPYYYTLYKNFDFFTKIDYPIVGEPTQYETANNYSYSSDNLTYNGNEYNALNLKNSSNDGTQNNLIHLKLNSYIEFICKINMVSSSAPLFIWTKELFGFYVDLNKGNTIGITCPQSAANYATKNGAYLNSVSYGIRWFLTPLSNNAVFKFRLDYLEDKVICSVDGVEYVVFNTTNSVDTELQIDPRMNNNVSITDIKCYLA